MRAESERELAFRSEGEELPHRGHGGCQRERLKRRTDKVQRAHGKRVVTAEVRIGENERQCPSFT